MAISTPAFQLIALVSCLPAPSIGTFTASSVALAGALHIDINEADPNLSDMLNVTDVLALADVTLTGTQSHPIYIFLHYGTLLGNPLCHYPGRSDLADGHWEGFLSDDIDSDVFQYRMIEIAFEFSPRSG